jgi:hypothetical protein
MVWYEKLRKQWMNATPEGFPSTKYIICNKLSEREAGMKHADLQIIGVSIWLIVAWTIHAIRWMSSRICDAWYLTLQ